MIPIEELQSPQRIHSLMLRSGCCQVNTRQVMAAALYYYKPVAYDDALSAAYEYFRKEAVFVPSGLETLPAAWLMQIPQILEGTRKNHWLRLPYFLSEVSAQQEVVCLSFLQEQPREHDSISMWDRLRITVNQLVTPSLFKALSPEVEKLVWDHKPNLRWDLMRT